MNYCIVNDENIIENIIVCDDPAELPELNILPTYDGATIGEPYLPPPPLPTQTEANTANIDYIAMMNGIDLPEQEVAE